MTAADPDPKDSRVVVVGIDEYRSGPEWALAGAVDDALRFSRFFLAQGVPPGQVTLLCTPRPAEVPAGVDCRPADRSTIRAVFTDELTVAGESRLYVMWGGHGFVDTDRRRRLYYADATPGDPIDLDLDSMLARFASDLVPGLDRQVWLVDVCQVHGPAGPLRVTGHETLSAGEPVGGREQDVLFAAGVGQRAANLNRQRTGLFSREALRLLEAGGLAALTRPEQLVSALRDKFTALRAVGLTRQTPTYFWYRNASGDEGYLLRGQVSSDPAPDAAVDGVRPAALNAILNALLAIPEMNRPNDREEILSLLRGSIYGAIRRNPTTRLDLISTIRTCLRYPGGLPELVEAVRFHVDDDAAVTRLEETIATLGIDKFR